MSKPNDPHLLDALTKAYIARAKLFHTSIIASKIDLLFAEVDAIDSSALTWNCRELGVSDTAFQRVRSVGGEPHQVFAHPDVVARRPHLIAYYRNIVSISKKGINQILFSTEPYETRRRETMLDSQALRLCQTLNHILSEVIDHVSDYSVNISRQAVLAEIGTELQGTWANLVGRGAARAVEDVLADYIQEYALGEHTRRGLFNLVTGWTIEFGTEPDVVFTDPAGVRQIVIEIKGSLDRAGAQTRYGEAKKSFAKEIDVNRRCYTIYLASCFTEAVIRQIQADGQVRDWFNLTSILHDPDERVRFLERVFHIVRTPP